MKCGGHYISGERCQSCKAKKVIDAYMQSKPSEDENIPPPEFYWKGLIRGCNKLGLLSEENKRLAIKSIRQSLLIAASLSRLNKEGETGNVDNVLREKLSSFPVETVDDIVENGCHAKLDDKSVTELSSIARCLVGMVSGTDE
jgi:hypothetical protein